MTLQDQEKLIFQLLAFLVVFLESLQRIRRKLLLFEKLFGRAPAGFSQESALEALPNAPVALTQ